MDLITFTTNEASKYLNLSVKTFRKIVDRGYIRRLNGIDRNWKFSRYELERYLKEECI